MNSQGNVKKAHQTLSQLITSNEIILGRFPKYQSKVFTEQGILFEQENLLDQSLKKFEESRRLNETRKDTFWACSDLLNVARIYLKQNDPANFKLNNSMAFEYAKASKTPLYEIKANLQLANYFGFNGQFDSCIVYALRGEKLAKETHNIQFQIETNDIIAACYMSLKNPKRAIEYQLKAFELSKQDYVKKSYGIKCWLMLY